MTCRLYNIYCIDVHSHNILLITLFMGLCNNYKKYFLPVYIPSLVGILHLNFSSLKTKSIFEEKKIPNLFSYRISYILDLGYDAIQYISLFFIQYENQLLYMCTCLLWLRFTLLKNASRMVLDPSFAQPHEDWVLWSNWSLLTQPQEAHEDQA